jgi:hypothetical protein
MPKQSSAQGVGGGLQGDEFTIVENYYFSTNPAGVVVVVSAER